MGGPIVSIAFSGIMFVLAWYNLGRAVGFYNHLQIGKERVNGADFVRIRVSDLSTYAIHLGFWSVLMIAGTACLVGGIGMLVCGSK